MDSLSQNAFPDNPIPATSGIYKITCIANGKIYIGSALNLYKRKNEHFRKLRRNKHENPKLQNACNKYGEQAFTFEVLEFVLSISLTAREQYWFKKLKPFGKKGFNIAREAGSNLGMKHTPEAIAKARGRKHTPEAIEKMRQAHIGSKRSPEARERMRQAQLGKKATEETRRKLSESHKGQVSWLKGKTVPEETRRKISNTLTGRKFDNSRRGYKKPPVSEEARRHNSESRKGKPHPCKKRFNPYGPDKKHCPKCNIVKSINDFYVRNPITMTTRSHCKKCNRDAWKKQEV